MGLFSGIKKSSRPEPAPAPASTSLSANFDVRTWKDFNEEIFAFLKESGVFEDLNKIDQRFYFTAELVPEPSNQYDRSAIQVYAKVKGKKSKYRIGYVPSPDNQSILALIPKAKAENYYWSGTAYYNFVTGCDFTINLRKSKF